MLKATTDIIICIAASPIWRY